MEPDKNVDFIMETILQVFRLNNKGHGNKLSIKMARSSESSSNYGKIYTFGLNFDVFSTLVICWLTELIKFDA
uniref:Uncharacterized protein n=1 Tax=Brugia malayi TaxID=6279 RepID=A8P595_BRUMA